jgi:Tfp pilus assembly protein PilX
VIAMLVIAMRGSQALLSRSRRRLSADDGFLMVSALLTMLVLALLVASAISVSLQGSNSTTRDQNSKTALAAAEAGLQVAAYRVGQLKPVESACVATSVVASPQSGAYCEGSAVENTGNGTKFQYWTSRGLRSSEKCAGRTVEFNAGLTQRCITAEGKAGGAANGVVSVRAQTLVQSALGESLFTVKGILGLEEVLVSGSVIATSIVVSNTKIIGQGSATFEKGYELCPGGTFTPKVGAERNSSGVAVGNVRGGYVGDPPLEIERSAAVCPIAAKIPAVHPSATANEDIRIATGEDPNTGEAKGLAYNAVSNEMEVGANAKLTLKGAKYYFCKLLVTSNGNLKIAAGAKVEIFIGSHAENSVCPKEVKKPKFEIAGSASLENPNGAANLLIEMAGEGSLEIGASGSLKASIFAPEGEVVLSGAGTLTGAIAANRVHLTAGSFIYGSESESLTVGGTGTGAYTRQAWEQCTPGSGANEGC